MDLGLAEDFLGAGRPDLAERELRRLLAGEPEHAGALALLAMALSAQDRYAGALAAAEEALRLQPDHPWAHEALAELHLRVGDGPSAEAAARAALELEPRSPRFHGLLAAALLRRRRHAEALQAAEAGLRLNPEHVLCLMEKAQALLRLGRLDEAREASAAGLRLSPDSAGLHAVHGAVELARGSREEGHARLREALRIDPNEAYAQTRLGMRSPGARDAAVVILQAREWKVPLGAVVALLALGAVASILRARPGATPWMALLSAAYLVFPLLYVAMRLRHRWHLLDDLAAPGALWPGERRDARWALVLWGLMGVGITLFALA